MSSIHVHQDIYNFVRKRKGFTPRQIGGLVCAAAACIGMTALLGYAARVPASIAVSAGLCVAMPFAFAGFVPIWGLPAEEALSRLLDLAERGDAICFDGAELDPMKGEVSREYRKKAKEKGFERRPTR